MFSIHTKLHSCHTWRINMIVFHSNSLLATWLWLWNMQYYTNFWWFCLFCVMICYFLKQANLATSSWQPIYHKHSLLSMGVPLGNFIHAPYSYTCDKFIIFKSYKMHHAFFKHIWFNSNVKNSWGSPQVLLICKLYGQRNTGQHYSDSL